MATEQGSFFDKKTIVAVVLTGVVLFGWNKYLAFKYPPSQKTDLTQAQEAIQNAAVPQTTQTTDSKKAESAPAAEAVETKMTVDTANYSLEVSSRGLGLKNIVLKNYKGRDLNNVVLSVELKDQEGLFAMVANGKPVHFAMEQSSSEGKTTVIGTATIGAAKIKRTLVFTEQYYLKSSIVVENAPSDFAGFQLLLNERRIEGSAGSIFSPSTEFQEFVVNNGSETKRNNITTAHETIQKSEGLFPVFGISSHYFVTAYSNLSDLMPEIALKAIVKSDRVEMTGNYKISNVAPKLEFDGVGFFGPKDFKVFDVVKSDTQQDLTHFVNFGYFESIGKILLRVLQFFHAQTIPNWGVAIILLTILVRLLVLPFNVASYRSMKKMQKIQPLLTSLRERYKEDPQRMNSETMELMKREKVNPIGGCLPMLLQMPVFFALYQVLGQSIELYQAPFFGWIHDLSLKDPFYVLPILMGVAMWYNQKITPSTMDPTQAKVMQYLPIVFSLMMVALPSGLTLYIFVSTIFGILQQQYFMRDKTAASKVTTT